MVRICIVWWVGYVAVKGTNSVVQSYQFRSVAQAVVSEECPAVTQPLHFVALEMEMLFAAFSELHRTSADSSFEHIPLGIGLKAFRTFLSDTSVDHSLCHQLLVEHLLTLGDYARTAGEFVRMRLLTSVANLFKLVGVRNWYRKILADYDERGISLDGRRAPFTRLYTHVAYRQQSLFAHFAVERRTLTEAEHATSGTTDRCEVACKDNAHTSSISIVSVCVYPLGTELVSLASTNHRAYASMHKYRYEMITQVPQGYVENPQFFKNNLIRDWAQTEAATEWLVLIDCDAFFTNMTTPVNSVMDTYGNENTQLFVAEDNGGINTGVLIVRRSVWVHRFFNSAMQHVHMAMSWDQSMVYYEMLLRSNLFDLYATVEYPPPGITLVHQGDLNAFHEGTAKSWNTYAWQRGDFVKHFAGCPHEEKECIALMRQTVREVLSETG